MESDAQADAVGTSPARLKIAKQVHKRARREFESQLRPFERTAVEPTSLI